MLRPVLLLCTLLFAAPLSAQTRESLLNDGFQAITCQWSERCNMGRSCESRGSQMDLLYSSSFRMLFRDEAGAGITPAMPISRGGDVFVAVLNDGQGGMLSIHPRGFALLSYHSNTSPPGGYFLRGTCDLPK